MNVAPDPCGAPSFMKLAQIGTRRALAKLLEEWRIRKLPSREELAASLQEILRVRENTQNSGLWEEPPLMLTSSLDDGWGNGLQLVELCARAAGLRVTRLGLLLPPDSILSECKIHLPDILGLTVLQFDSEDPLTYMRKNLPNRTHLVLGGPVFAIDPDLSSRIGAHFVARNIADFLEFLLHFKT